MGEIFQGVVVAARSKPQPKGFDGGVCQSALFAQVGQNIFVCKKLGAVINDRILQQFAEVFVGFLLLWGLALVFFYFHTRAQRQLLHGFLEVQSLALHDELENIPALVTLTKATPRPRLGPDHKGRRVLVIVEGAKACVVLPRVAQFYASLGDEVDDINSGFDFI